jgi:hypothetical protein
MEILNTLVNLALIAGGTYVAYLLIKALRIFIKKNS